MQSAGTSPRREERPARLPEQIIARALAPQNGGSRFGSLPADSCGGGFCVRVAELLIFCRVQAQAPAGKNARRGYQSRSMPRRWSRRTGVPVLVASPRFLAGGRLLREGGRTADFVQDASTSPRREERPARLPEQINASALAPQNGGSRFGSLPAVSCGGGVCVRVAELVILCRLQVQAPATENVARLPALTSSELKPFDFLRVNLLYILCLSIIERLTS